MAITHIYVIDRAVEQLVARWAHNPKVAGSNPVRANRAGTARTAE
jgi:hypothetical protein